MEKLFQFPNLNEDTSHDQLFDFTRVDIENKKKNQHKLLMDKLSNNINSLNRSHSSHQLNNSNSTIKLNREKNINFKNNKTKISLLTFDLLNRKSSSSLNKNRRKTSIIDYIGKNPLAFIESLKKLEENNSYHGRTLLKIKFCDILLGIFSIISISFAFIDNELYSSKSLDYLNKIMTSLEQESWTFEMIQQLEHRKISDSENFFRILNLIISILSCIPLIIKYNLQLYIAKMDKKVSEYDNLFSSRLIIWLFLECLISIICFLPHLNIVYCCIRIYIVYAYSLNRIFLPLNALKLYNVFRLIMLFSRYNTKVSQTICQSYKTTSGISFVVKSEINNKKITIITFTLIFLCVFATGIIRDFECLSFDKNTFLEGKKGLNDLQNYVNNLWLILITFTNVGYGDKYPRTFFGRIIIFLVSFLGLLGLGIIIATLSEKLEFDQNEKKAYLRLKKIFDPENIEHKAGNVIKTLLHMSRNIKLKGSGGIEKSANLREKICLLLKIRAETKCFSNELHVSRVYSMPINDLVKTLETKLYDNLCDINKDLDSINNIENDFKLLEENQIFIQQKLSKINYLQIEIGKYLLEKQNNNYLNKDKISQKSSLKSQNDKLTFKEKENSNIENKKTNSHVYIIDENSEIKKKEKAKKKNILKTFYKQISYKSSHESKFQNNLNDNILSHRKSKRIHSPFKKISIFKFKKNKIFKLISEIQIIPRKIKSSKYINKLFLGETEKNKIKKKKNALDKTTIPFLGIELNFLKKINYENNMNLKEKTPQLISLEIPQAKQTTIKLIKK